jgi:hypothetical protein
MERIHSNTRTNYGIPICMGSNVSLLLTIG